MSQGSEYSRALAYFGLARERGVSDEQVYREYERRASVFLLWILTTC
jgi:hypothetical protein